MVLSYLLIWSKSRKKKIHTYPVYCKLTLMRVCQTDICWIYTESGENTSLPLHLCGWGSAFCQSCKPAIRPEDATEKKNLVYLVYHVSSWRPGSREVVQGSQPSSVRQIEAVPKWQFGPLFFFDSFEFNRNNGTVFFNDCKPFFVQYVSTTCFCSVVWKRPQTATCSRHCYLQMLWCCLCELDFFCNRFRGRKSRTILLWIRPSELSEFEAQEMSSLSSLQDKDDFGCSRAGTDETFPSKDVTAAVPHWADGAWGRVWGWTVILSTTYKCYINMLNARFMLIYLHKVVGFSLSFFFSNILECNTLLNM